jgi:hypothetical protein
MVKQNYWIFVCVYKINILWCCNLFYIVLLVVEAFEMVSSTNKN